MKRDYEHILHSVILGFVAYVVMVYLLKQNSSKACSRSIIVAAGSLIYMIMFGHNFPPRRISSSVM